MMENKTNTKSSSSSKKEKSTFADYKAEFKKIVWPTGAELRKQTITVIITSIIIAAVIFGLDTLYSAGQGLIINRITGGAITIDESNMDMFNSQGITIDSGAEDEAGEVIEGAEDVVEDVSENVENTVDGALSEEAPADSSEAE